MKPTLTRLVASVGTAVILAAAPTSLQAQEPSSVSDVAWARLRKTAPGSEVVVTTRGASKRRHFVEATESTLVVLNLGDVALPRQARAVLLEAVSQRPAVFSIDGRITYVTGNARVGPDGVFVAGRKVADLSQVVERIARADLLGLLEVSRGSIQPATSFEELQTLVKPGETIIVTGLNGRTTKGVLGRLSPTMLELLVRVPAASGTTTTVAQPPRAPSDVREIQVVRPDPLWNGILIGAAPGLGLAILCAGCTFTDNRDGHALPNPFAIGAAIGAGVGLLIDWARKDPVTIYQTSTPRSSTVQIAPLVTKHGAGALLSVRF